jgi:Skp family chaperone for outer membrane proteins
MATLVVAFFAVAPMSKAAPAPSTASGFASVDLAKVYAGSKAKQSADAELQATGAKYDTTLKTLQNNLMLSQSNLTLLAALLVKDAPTADDTKQITEFEAQAKADSDALQALQQKADKDQTADDKVKLASLSTEYQTGQQALQQVQQTFQDSMQQKNDELNQEAAALIHAAVAKVAAKQNIAVVFSSQVAVYSSNDITDQVAAEMAK